MSKSISILDPLYPQDLTKIKKVPENLFYKGDWDCNIFKNCLAVVGSRNGTEYGRRITKKLVMELAYHGITIVSGFMYGIDSVAHQACVDAGGRTIAVLPYGIDSKVPEYQKYLFNEILNYQGLIVSEYASDLKAQKYTFVERNRLVVGLSKAVLVVEGALNSGTMVTASLAKKFDKPLFAVAGHIDSKVSEGVNNLIKEGTAEMVTSAKDILKIFDTTLTVVEDGTNNYALSPLEKDILNLLQIDSLSLDDLVLKTKFPASKLSVSLTTMVLSGYLNEKGGKYYVG